jgi:DNA-binding transcriptional ArsR family regulator
MLTPHEKKRLEKHVHDIDVHHMATVFDALSEPNRCLIFRALLTGSGVSVNDVAAVVGISPPLASQHLKVLMSAGLLSRNKAGKNVYYEINHEDRMVVALQAAVERS